jgi:hypothetical protein
MQETNTPLSPVFSLSNLHGATADYCGQKEKQYYNADNEVLVRYDNGIAIRWHSNRLNKDLVYSEFSKEKLSLYFNKNTSFSVITVIFANGASAIYYSEDGNDCVVDINNPAADVAGVTANK